MNDCESVVKARVLKEKWQEYFKCSHTKEKEGKLKEFLLLLVGYNNDNKSVLSIESELSSIANLLGCELLRVIHRQCGILENDSDLVKYFQKESGLYLIQALHILAGHVTNCNSEVSKVVASILPCFLTISCDTTDEQAFQFLQKLSILFNDMLSNKAKPNMGLYEIFVTSNSEPKQDITLLQLLTMLLDIISKLSLRNCSLSAAESFITITEKLTIVLYQFVKENGVDNLPNTEVGDLTECTWSITVKTLCICMLQYTIWLTNVCRRQFDMFSYRVDQINLVKNMLMISKRLKEEIWVESDFTSDTNSMNLISYKLFLAYSMLGVLITLLKTNVSCESACVSDLDLGRKLHARKQVDLFIQSTSDLFMFVALSLNEILAKLSNPVCITLLKERAVSIMAITGQLLSVLEKSTMVSDPKMKDVLSEKKHRDLEYHSFKSKLEESKGSSSENDGKSQLRTDIAIKKYLDDSGISCLCCSILMVYKASIIEEIDFVCLKALSRCSAIFNCITSSVIVLSLLSRFVERSIPVQDMALVLLCKTLLKGQDVATKRRRGSSRSHSEERMKDDTQEATEWSSIEQLYTLITHHDRDLALKVFKHIKILAKFGCPSLKTALFTSVILPFFLGYEPEKRVNILKQAIVNTATGNPYDSGYVTPTEANENQLKPVITSGQRKTKTMTPAEDDILCIALSSLLSLLRESHLQRFFLNSGAARKIQVYIGHEPVHSITLAVFQLLANQNYYRTKRVKVPPEESEDVFPIVTEVLLHFMFLLDNCDEPRQALEPNEQTLRNFASKLQNVLRSLRASRLLCEIWATCVNLLRHNTTFRECFAQINGYNYVIVVLQVIKECLYRATIADYDVKEHVISCMTLLEYGIAVGLEFENELVDHVMLRIQLYEALKVIQSLIQKNKVLKRLIGKQCCSCLLSLAIGCPTNDYHSSNLRVSDSEKLFFDLGNSDDSASEGDYVTEDVRMMRVRDEETGYEADAELENRSSDVSREDDVMGDMRPVKSVMGRRHSTSDIQGHIRHPSMCLQLINMLKCDATVSGDDKLLVMFAMESLTTLASFSVRNREILCENGVVSLVLKTFTPCLGITDSKIKAVQRNILDFITVLASYRFTPEELKMYFMLLNNMEPDWALLIKALRNIASMSSFLSGPSYTHVFPVKSHEVPLDSTTTASPVPRHRRRSGCDSPLTRPSSKVSTITSKQSMKHKARERHPRSTHCLLEIHTLSSPWTNNAVELKTNQCLSWPVASFSIAFWVYLDPGSIDMHANHSPRSSRRRHVSRDSRRHAKETPSRYLHVISFGTKTAWFEVWVNVSKTSLICRWVKKNMEVESQTSLKFPLKDNIWYHLVISVRSDWNEEHSGQVTFIVDGAQETTKPLSHPNIPVHKNEPLVLMIGDTDNGKSADGIYQPEPLYHLGNVFTFIGDLHKESNVSSSFISLLSGSSRNHGRSPKMSINKTEASFLHLLGPNCQAINYHLNQETTQCNCVHLDVKFLGDVLQNYSAPFLSGPHGQPVFIDQRTWDDVKVSLKKQLFLVYSPVNPKSFLEYKLEGTEWPSITSHSDYVITGTVTSHEEIEVSRRQRIIESVHNVGGIGVFLYLFAKTVEMTCDEKIQADALSTIFALANENIVYAKELGGLLANKMMKKILLAPKCKPGFYYMKVFFSAACDGDLFRETGLYDQPFVVNLNSRSLVKNYEILRDFLLNWRIWYRVNVLIWQTVLLALEALICNTNQYSEFNIEQFERADALDTLLLGCQEIQADDLEFSSSICCQYLNIIQNLLGCTGKPAVLKRLCEFLVAVHPTYDTFVIHAASNLYLSSIAKLADTDETLQGVHRKISLVVDTINSKGKDLSNEGKKSKDGADKTQTSIVGSDDVEVLVHESVTDDVDHDTMNIAHVVNMTDSKNIIISVEHVREKDENELEFPLSQIESNLQNSSDGIHDNTDQPSSEDGDENRIHSEPIPITTDNEVLSLGGSYDVVSSSEVNTKSQSRSTDDYLVVDHQPGGCPSTLSTYRHYRRTTPEHHIDKRLDDLRVGLLELICSCLVNIGDVSIDIVLGTALKAEYFLCFVNHPSPRIRTLSIKIIHKILERASLNVLNTFHRIHGFHLLAVQIHLHPITQEVAEACFSLFFQQPISINQPLFLETITPGSEITKKMNIPALVPLLGMLEGAVFCPEVFQYLVKCLVRTLDVIEDFLLQATDQGLLKTLVNATRAMAVLEVNQNKQAGDTCSTDVQSLLDNIQYLVMAIVYRSLRMCGDRYFQIFDDLLLFLDQLQYSDSGNTRLTTELTLLSRFLQQCTLKFALEYFENSQRLVKFNRRTFQKALRLSFKTATDKVDISRQSYHHSISNWSTLDPSKFPVLWRTARHISLPTDATPTEVTSRFQDICKRVVNLICLPTDNLRSTENTLSLSYSQLNLLPPFQCCQQSDPTILVNSTEVLTQWVFCFLLENLDFCLNEEEQLCMNKWHDLIKQSKDKIRQQLCRLFVYLMSPNQKSRQKYFALQLTKMKRGHEIFLNLVLGVIATKQKERAVVYVRSFLQNPGTEDMTSEQEEIVSIGKQFLKDVELQKLDKINPEELDEKQLEWDKQDRNNKIQWESKKDAELKRTYEELRQLCQRIMSVAMEVTKVSVDVQDRQRQNLLKHVKTALSTDVQSQKLWHDLIRQLTHERAIWHDKEFFATSWQLDPTEGPSRLRVRLQRCHLNINDKFVMPEHRKKGSNKPPLSYIFEEHNNDASSKNVYHIFNTTDSIRFLHRCKSIMPARKIQGEILIGERQVYFVGEGNVTEANSTQLFVDDEDVTSVSWSYQEIRQILRRRYALQDNALEIFLANGRTFLLAFETTQNRETVYKELMANELPNVIIATENVTDLTQKWQNGEMTNFAYLTELNKQACRSFNDLMQYPVFPLVLAEYTSDVLDLTNKSAYRDLSKPVAVQNASKVTKFKNFYKNLQEQYDISKKIDPMDCIPPYHYGSHYSNSGVVLHFLVRLVPFTKMFWTYQDKQFDVPDRTFHAIETTWNLSSLASTPDVKELIPEFFFLPEFLLNTEGFDFGIRQNGERVMDVKLPSWACNNTRLFIRIHRQALESDVVSSMINHWIDLIFGFKQEGEAAVEAINVFHPSTYVGGIDRSRVRDTLQEKAIETMIETYGQMPAKLFKEPHAERRRAGKITDSSSSMIGDDSSGSQISIITSEHSQYNNRSQEPVSPVSTVYGIKWGHYVGSPSFPKPVLCWSETFSPCVTGLVCLPSSHLFLVPAHSTHMIVTRWKNKAVNITWSAVMTWNHVDDILRIRHFKKGSAPLCFMENINLHKVTCCAVSEQCLSLWVGSTTGCLCVWSTRYDRNNERGLELLGRCVRLQGHQASITCIEICEEFGIVVTGSEDNTVIIWDLNRLCYIRSLTDHPSALSIVAISPSSGDIVTICHKTDQSRASELRLWSINGSFVEKIVCSERITCAQFSSAPEGVSVNAIAAGLINGTVRLWNTWTLQHMCDIVHDGSRLPITCLSYSVTCQHLFTVDTSGTIRAWGRNDRTSYKPRVIDCVH